MLGRTWPLQDIVSLQSLIVEVNHPFTAPLLGLTLLYAIHHTRLVMAISCKGFAAPVL